MDKYHEKNQHSSKRKDMMAYIDSTLKIHVHPRQIRWVTK